MMMIIVMMYCRMHWLYVIWLVGHFLLASWVCFHFSSRHPDLVFFFFFLHNMNRKNIILFFLFLEFSEGYCWTRTGERQAARMRARYLKAVLRQEVAYFDLHVTSTSEVITSVSNDSLVIQDVLSEKVREIKNYTRN